MLGWHIRICRQKDDGSAPTTGSSRLGDLWEEFHAHQGDLLAEWQAHIDGLDWLNALVKVGVADFTGNGYPYMYSAPSHHLLPRFVKVPPKGVRSWIAGHCEVHLDRWGKELMVDNAVVEACRPNEWLLVEVWDES